MQFASGSGEVMCLVLMNLIKRQDDAVFGFHMFEGQ
jgi:hypothetical protein